MSRQQSKITLKLGTAVKIQTVLSQNDPDGVTIEIEDPSEKVKIDYVAMTKVAPNVYQYIYQSSANDDDGEYKITIKATYGSYTSIEQNYFILEDID
jgi:hypothetical protein